MDKTSDWPHFIIQNVPDGIITVDGQMRITDLNRAAWPASVTSGGSWSYCSLLPPAARSNHTESAVHRDMIS